MKKKNFKVVIKCPGPHGSIETEIYYPKPQTIAELDVWLKSFGNDGIKDPKVKVEEL